MNIEFYVQGEKHPFAYHEFEQPVPIPEVGEEVVVVSRPGEVDSDMTEHEVLSRRFLYYGVKRHQLRVMLYLSEPA